MANRGNGRYMKRLNAPVYFGIERKGYKYVTKPTPGRHALDKCIPLSVALKQIGEVKTTSEASKAIKSRAIRLNGKIMSNPRYPIGISDVITVANKSYVCSINSQGKFAISESKSSETPYIVVGKYKSKNGTIMLCLHDGTNIGYSKPINVNDSIYLKDKKVSKHIKLDVGAQCSVINGVHVGARGKIISISSGSMHKQRSVVIESSPEVKFETLVRNVMVTSANGTG